MSRAAAEAVEILGKADVMVTNKKDKETLLPLLLKLEDSLKAKKAIVPIWVEKRQRAEDALKSASGISALEAVAVAVANPRPCRSRSETHRRVDFRCRPAQAQARDGVLNVAPCWLRIDSG